MNFLDEKIKEIKDTMSNEIIDYEWKIRTLKKFVGKHDDMLDEKNRMKLYWRGGSLSNNKFIFYNNSKYDKNCSYHKHEDEREIGMIYYYCGQPGIFMHYSKKIVLSWCGDYDSIVRPILKEFYDKRIDYNQSLKV